MTSYFSSLRQVIDMIAGITDPKKAVDVLVAEANARWMKEEQARCYPTGAAYDVPAVHCVQVIDDTTVIVAFLEVA
jgi:hypothetical protein